MENKNGQHEKQKWSAWKTKTISMKNKNHQHAKHKPSA